MWTLPTAELPGPRTAPAWEPEPGSTSGGGSSNAPLFPRQKDVGVMTGPLGENDYETAAAVRETSGIIDRERQIRRGDVVGPAEGDRMSGNDYHDDYRHCPEGGARLRGLAGKVCVCVCPGEGGGRAEDFCCIYSVVCGQDFSECKRFLPSMFLRTDRQKWRAGYWTFLSPVRNFLIACCVFFFPQIYLWCAV